MTDSPHVRSWPQRLDHYAIRIHTIGESGELAMLLVVICILSLLLDDPWRGNIMAIAFFSWLIVPTLLAGGLTLISLFWPNRP